MQVALTALAHGACTLVVVGALYLFGADVNDAIRQAAFSAVEEMGDDL